MANIVDDIKWRGDIPFSASALNEVDAALFCLISYWDMDGVVSDKLDETITLKELCNSDILVKLPYYCSEEDRTIKELLKYSERFSEVKISKYINNVDTERQIQFSAVTFSFDKKSTFVAYRGTDDSLVGWKECMDLAYSEEVEVPVCLEGSRCGVDGSIVVTADRGNKCCRVGITAAEHSVRIIHRSTRFEFQADVEDI